MFTMTYIDPCDPPNSLMSPNLINQVYTINDMMAPDYTHAAFMVDPNYCPLFYTYTETPFTDLNGMDATAISRSDFTYSFFWGDLSPLG